MKTSMITVKTDPKVKKEIQKFSENIGISLSALTNAFYKKVIRERHVDFSDSYVPNEKTGRALLRARQDYREGRNISPTFDNAKDAIAYLRSKMK